MGKTVEKVVQMHFTIDGEWFTWFLRHQWIEGNEAKAIRTWEAAFPHLGAKEHLTGVFLEVVSGKKKFTGNSDGPNGFDLKDDKTKYWSTTAGGKPSKLYPLVDSWEDVFERKAIQLFLAELDIRDIRLNRQYPPTREENGYLSNRWIRAAEENEQENRSRKRMADLLASIENLSLKTGIKFDPIEIPTEGTLLEDKSIRDVKWPSRKVRNNPSLDNNKKFHAAVIYVLEGARQKFLKKYGQELVRYDPEQIALLCGMQEAERWAPHETLTADVSAKAKVKSSYRADIVDWKDALAKAIKDALDKGDTERALMLQRFTQPASIPGLPDMDVNKYVDDLVKAEHRTSIDAENVAEMTWDSGYIAPTGEFYGCPDIQHREFSKDLIEKFKLAPKKGEGYSWMKAKRGEQSRPLDPEIIMDRAGWIRVSVRRFFWDREHHKPTDQQKQTILDFMSAKKIKEAVFNNPLEKVSFEKGMKDD